MSKQGACVVQSHDNGFGLLRLLFAALVIVSHTPEFVDGDRSREILTLLFGSLSFGELAVDSFFVISGYLITASFLKASSPLDYAVRRVARIYPGFLVAYILCVLVVAPLGGAVWPETAGQVAGIVVKGLTLQKPDVGAVFAGQPYAELNGATWTIIHEFQCYALVMGLGVVGILRHRGAMLALTAAACLVAMWRYHPHIPTVTSNAVAADLWSGRGLADFVAGVLRPSVRLVGVFLVGCCYYLQRDRLRFSGKLALGAGVLLVLALSVPRLADTGYALFGGYLILFFAHWASGRSIARINNPNDVSYGLYLYAWPVEKLTLFAWPTMPLWQAGAITLVVAYGLGWGSWLLVERPALLALRRWRQRAKHPQDLVLRLS